MTNLPTKWRKDAAQYMRQVAEATEKGIPCDRMAGCADGLRESAKELERAKTSPKEQVEFVTDWLIEWERELREKAGPIGDLDFDAHRMAGKVGDVRREMQERFGLVSVPGK